ncbi:MAG TPA: hypothetical protein VGY76_02540 [Solirubrobacteraceae bacterium]|nr:hypothetical protein [Solirubrobacteraceae bacterium]
MPSVSPTAGASLPGLSGLVLRRARLRLHRLQDELGALRAVYAEREDLPGLRTLVDAMKLLASEAERELVYQARASFARLQRGEDQEIEEKRFRGQVAGLIRAIENSLPSPMQLAREPHGREVEALIAPFSQMISRVMRRESVSMELIFEPSDDYSFQLSALHELKPVAERLGEGREAWAVMDKLPQLTVIAYPRHMEAETLMHAVMAHEIAHLAIDPICSRRNAREVAVAFDQAVQDRWRELELAIEGDQPVRALTDENVEESGSTVMDEHVAGLRKWYVELLCDTLAVALVGPAYPLALADLDAASNRWGQFREASHPGLTWRLTRSIDLAQTLYLDAAHEAGMVGEEWDALNDALRHMKEKLPEESDSIEVVEKEVVEQALNTIDPRRMVGEAFYEPKVLQSDLPIIWRKLVKGIPPAEKIALRSSDEELPAGVFEEPAGEIREPAGEIEELAGVIREPAGEIREPERWSWPICLPSIFNGAYAWWHAGKARQPEYEGGHRRLPDRPRALEDWLEFSELIRGTIELAALHERLWSEYERLDALNPPLAAPQLASI